MSSSESLNSSDIQCKNANELCENCENSFVTTIKRKPIDSPLITSTPLNHSIPHSSQQSPNDQQFDQNLNNNEIDINFNNNINTNETNPFDESIVYDISMNQIITADSYEQSLSQLTDNKFLSLRQLELINATDEQLIDRVVNIYGIVDSVTNITELNKKVLIIDPTKSDGISILINNILSNIATKNIIRLTNVSIVTSSNGKEFTVNERKNFAQFDVFTYDYESDDEYNYQIVFAKNNLNLESDKLVAKLLEEWFAQQFLNNHRLNKLVMSQNNKTYVDFACLVIGTQLMRQSIQLIIYDGSEPNFVIESQYINDNAIEGISNSYHRFNNDEVYQNNFNRQHFGYVNVWRNKSNQNNDHYEKAEGITLINGDDLLIFFNVELMKGTQDGFVKLNLRSGRHHGKGIRKVNRLSILGRKLILRIRAHNIKPIHQNLNTSQDMNNDLSNISFNELRDNNQTTDPLMMDQNLCQKRTTSTKTLNELLELGSRKLQALLDQQIKEKDYPLIYQNDYKYDLNLIKDALKRSRELPHFPNIISEHFNSTLQLTEIQNLNNTEDNIDELFLVRAKVIDIFPKSVFPINQFIYLKCNFCHFKESFKNLSNSVNANFPSCVSQILQCPQCTDRTNSVLTHFYAIVFEIQDSNSKTKVCLTNKNAVNVFGVEPIQVLNDSKSALRLDNILFEIVKKSTQENRINWIIKKRKNNHSIHEVISIAPNDHQII